MTFTPQLAAGILELALEIKRELTPRIRTARGDDSYQPTIEELLVEVKANAQRVIDEGEAWKRDHPTPASGS